MWFKKTKDYLSITDKTIKYTDKKHTNQVYQLSNITQITKHKLTHKRIAKVILSLMLAAVGVGLAIAGERQPGLQPLAAAAFTFVDSALSLGAIAQEPLCANS